MKPISIEDRDLFVRQPMRFLNSEYQFSTLFIWQKNFGFQYELFRNTILVFGYQHNGNLQCYYPIGPKEELPRALSRIIEVFHMQNKPVNLRPLNQKMVDELVGLLPFKYKIGSKDSYSDYICDYKRILTYSGSEYRQKRKEWNRFNSLYEHTYEAIAPQNYQECYDALDQIVRNNPDHDVEELAAYNRLFSEYDKLNLRGGLIRINGRIEAIAIGEAIENMVLMHLRRANKYYKGIYPSMLKMILTNSFIDRDYSIINFQDDMGLPNIRKAKMTYKPKYLLKKYYIEEIIQEERKDA